MNYLARLESEISQWPSISVHPHRFGGREFLFGKAEVGHIHLGGVVDIPFTRAIHDELLTNALAEEHRFVPNSGWITFRVGSEQDLKHALWLTRLSYLRYLLKSDPNPRQLFEQESQRLNLNSQFKSLLEVFIPRRTDRNSSEAIVA
jgi:Luciferase